MTSIHFTNVNASGSSLETPFWSVVSAQNADNSTEKELQCPPSHTPELKNYGWPIDFQEETKILSFEPSILQEEAPSLNQQRAFTRLIERIFTALTDNDLSLFHYFDCIEIKNLWQLTSFLWTKIKQEDVTDLLLDLIPINLNETILYLTYHPCYQKNLISVQLSKKLFNCYLEHPLLAYFYLDLLIKEHIIDFSKIESFLLNTLLFARFDPNSTNVFIMVNKCIAESWVKDLKYHDFQKCGFNVAAGLDFISNFSNCSLSNKRSNDANVTSKILSYHSKLSIFSHYLKYILRIHPTTQK